MAILKVAHMGHPVLREKTKPISPSEIGSPRIQQLIDDMFETMAEYSGCPSPTVGTPPSHRSIRPA